MAKLRYNGAFRGAMVAILIGLLLGGTIFLLSVVAKIQYDGLVSDMKPLKATIVEIDWDRHVRGPSEQEMMITYMVDGIAYTRELKTDTPISFSPGMGAHYMPGDQIDIFYDPQNPEVIAVPRSISVGYFYMVISIIFLILMISALYFVLKNRKMFLITRDAYQKEKQKRKQDKLANRERQRKKATMNGEKIRWQYFNTCLYMLLSFLPAIFTMILVMELKKGTLDWSGLLDTLPVMAAIYLVFVGPVAVLSILNRHSFGKIVGVVTPTTLVLDSRSISLDEIEEIVYHPNVLSRKRAMHHFAYATLVLRSESGELASLDVLHFPRYGVRKIKKYRPQLKVAYENYVWLLACCPTVLLAVFGALM